MGARRGTGCRGAIVGHGPAGTTGAQTRIAKEPGGSPGDRSYRESVRELTALPGHSLATPVSRRNYGDANDDQESRRRLWNSGASRNHQVDFMSVRIQKFGQRQSGWQRGKTARGEV